MTQTAVKPSEIKRNPRHKTTGHTLTSLWAYTTIFLCMCMQVAIFSLPQGPGDLKIRFSNRLTDMWVYNQ